MGGEGSMKALNDSLKANRALRRKTSIFSRERTFLNLKKEYVKYAGGEIKLKQLTESELALLKIKFKLKRKRENLAIIFISIVGVIISCFFAYSFVSNSNQSQKSVNDEAKYEQYEYLISDGDYHLELGNWHNAIFQYNLATELYPNDYYSQYRLAYAYTYQCRNENVDCEIAKEQVERLLKYFPSNTDVLELESILNKVEFEKIR